MSEYAQNKLLCSPKQQLLFLVFLSIFTIIYMVCLLGLIYYQRTNGGTAMNTAHNNMCFSFICTTAIGVFGLCINVQNVILRFCSILFFLLTCISMYAMNTSYDTVTGIIAISGYLWIICAFITNVIGLFYGRRLYYTYVLIQFIWLVFTWISLGIAINISSLY
jgi:hypothetical protein